MEAKIALGHLQRCIPSTSINNLGESTLPEFLRHWPIFAEFRTCGWRELRRAVAEVRRSNQGMQRLPRRSTNLDRLEIPSGKFHREAEPALAQAGTISTVTWPIAALSMLRVPASMPSAMIATG